MATSNEDRGCGATRSSIAITTPAGVVQCEPEELVPRRLGVACESSRLIVEYLVPSQSIRAHHCIDLGAEARRPSSKADVDGSDALVAAIVEQLRREHEPWLRCVSSEQLMRLVGRIVAGVLESGAEVQSPAADCRLTPIEVSTLDPKLAESLRQLLFGKVAERGRSLPMEWLQAWLFEPAAAPQLMPYGLRQAEGGPCGVVAPMQAFLLRRLMMAGLKPSVATAGECRGALLDAMADVLFQCGPTATLLSLPPGSNSSAATWAQRLLKTPAGCQVRRFPTAAALRGALESEALAGSFFGAEDADAGTGGAGILLFTYSALATRGVSLVRADADIADEVTVLGAYGYCTQEFVNLLLTGRARSNLFDGEHFLSDAAAGGQDGSSGLRLRGTEDRSEVGFLSLFEAFGSLEVGQLLKTPKWPIWVVHAESHYSVLFGRCHLSEEEKEEAADEELDVWYYDPLGRQDEEKRITVKPGTLEVAPEEDDLEENGMIAKVIRTKWGRLAALDWNGAEPIY